jgi:hypothetical protein
MVYNNHTESTGLKDIATKHKECGFDPHVYTANQQMKAVNQSKRDDPRI